MVASNRRSTVGIGRPRKKSGALFEGRQVEPHELFVLRTVGTLLREMREFGKSKEMLRKRFQVE